MDDISQLIQIYKIPRKSHSPSQNIGVTVHCLAKRLDFVSYESRLGSFSHWPSDANANAAKLAEAGFYYIGVFDYVKCYCCGGNLCHWKVCDDPWIEHCKWFPHCAFVNLSKGYSFIASCRRKETSLAEKADPDVLLDERTGEEELSKLCTSGLVTELLSKYDYPVDVVHAVINERWIRKEGMFESIESLNEAVLNCLNRSETLESSEKIITDTLCNNEGDERLVCKICLNNEIGVLFLPCGHTISCIQCALEISHCAVCREKINGVVRCLIS